MSKPMPGPWREFPDAASPAVAALLISVIGLVAEAQAATLHVPAEHPTIQAGLDAAVEGDTVLVAPGTYSGDGNRALTFRGRDLVLRSEAGPSMTVIACGGWPWQGVTFHQGESDRATVDGFTMDQCSGWPGGAFSFMNSSPTIRNCIIQRSSTTGTYVSHPTFLDCLFHNNRSSENGGGVTVHILSSMLIERCTFFRNSNHSLHHGGAIYVEQGCEATIRDCLIVSNASARDGGGVYVGGSATITGSTISDNCAFGDGGAVYVAGEASIERSILSFNTNYTSDCGTGVIVASCTNVFGNEGGDWVGCLAGQGDDRGNFALDPLFCDRRPSDICYGDEPIGKYMLDSRSPCAPEHSAGCGLMGALPVACGVTAIEEGTWGGIKARFRDR